MKNVRNAAPAGSLTVAACLLLATLLIAAYLTPTAVGQTPRIPTQPIRAVVLIDESGSQSVESVKAEVNAASLLAQAELSNQSSFMVVGFASSNGKGQSAFVQYCPFITVTDYAARERASACAERAHRRSPKEGDDTDHAAALDFAVGQLADAPKGTARVVFLLTDGNLNVCDSPQYGRTCKARNREAKRQLDQRILPAARRAEIAIWPLGFGPVTRRDGLESFARGGASGNEQCKGAKGTQPRAVVVGDSETILNVLLDLLASARCAQAGPPDGGLLEGGKTVSLEVKLPSIATDGAISVTKLDPRFTVEYFDPDGDEAIDRGEVDGQTFSRSGQNGQVEALRIENPKPGTWTVKVTAPAGRPAQRVLARAVWSGALQASIRISPVLPKPGQRVTVELYLITRYGVIRDPAELKGIVASAQVSGDFGSQTIALNDAGKDGDTKAGDGTFSGPFTMPGGKVGCFEVTGQIASPGVAADRRLYSLCSSKGSLSAIFKLAVPKTVHGGDAVTGTIDFDNELGPQRLRLVVDELSNGAQVSVSPASFAVAQGASKRKFELRIASGSPIGDLSGRLQLVDAKGTPLLGDAFFTSNVEAVPGVFGRYWLLIALCLAAIAGAAGVSAATARRRRRAALVGGLFAVLTVSSSHPRSGEPPGISAPERETEFPLGYVSDEEGPRLLRPGPGAETTFVVRRSGARVSIEGPGMPANPVAPGTAVPIENGVVLTINDRRTTSKARKRRGQSRGQAAGNTQPVPVPETPIDDLA